MDKREIKDIIQWFKVDKKAQLILAAALAGIILIVISSAASVPDEAEASEQSSEEFDEEEYTTALEKRLEEMISLINGAGEARVIVTLECDYETVYARDGRFSKDGNSTDEDSEYIIIDSEEAQGGLLLKTVTPRIRGVAVVCGGGDNPYVECAVVEMLSSVLDVGTNHISVSKIK